MPFSSEPNTDRIRALPDWTNEAPPPGRVYRYSTGNGPISPLGEPHILLSSSAVSLVNPERRTLTIMRDEVAVLLRWKDGVHQLISTGGKGLNIVPNRWQDSESLIPELTNWFEPYTIKEMGFRAMDPDAWDLPKKVTRFASSSEGPIGNMVHLLDGAGRHFRDPQFGSARGAAQAYVRGALTLGWLADRMLLAPWVEAGAAEALVKYRAAEIDRCDLYQKLEGLLATDMVVTEAKRFLVWLYSSNSGSDSKIGQIFATLEAPLDNKYDLVLSAEVLNQFDESIDRRLSRDYAYFGGSATQLKKLIRARAETPPPPRGAASESGPGGPD